MNILWKDYKEASGSSKDFYAHCDETLDIHGKNSCYQLMALERYLGDIPIFSSNLCDSKDNLISILRELTYFHDLGKANDKFKEELDKNCAGSGNKLPPHSENGFKKILAHIIEKLKKDQGNKTLLLAFLLSTIVDRHHSHLKNIDEYSSYVSNCDPSLLKIRSIIRSNYPQKESRYDLYFTYRLFYSCIKTADIFATSFGSFVEDLDQVSLTPEKIASFKSKLDEELRLLNKENTVIAKQREKFRKMAVNRILHILDKNPQKRIFFLYLPTGGGKTLTSLSMALEIAERKNLKRIFYVFPYINIIEQNSLILEKIFGDDLKAIHTYSDPIESEHGNTREKKEEEIEMDHKHFFNAEILNFPAVVVSSVRFFDILFSNKKSSVVKTWALANSVVIIDEVQYFPKKYWEAFTVLLAKFGRLFNTYFILMSATLPQLKMFLEKDEEKLIADVIIKEDISKEVNEFESRARIVPLEINDADRLVEEVIKKVNELIKSQKRILVVLNTIEMSKKIYDNLRDQIKCDVDIYLLNSTLLYPRRLEILDALSSQDGKKVLVSTQSIEAGVDLDFDVGIREKAPLESIMQIKGRINREMKNKDSLLYVTTKSPDVNKIYRDFRVLNVYNVDENLNDPNQMDKYFKEIISKLRNIGTESPRLLSYVRDLDFSKVGNAAIIDKMNSLDVFFDGEIRIKDKYSIGKNSIRIKERVENILKDHDFMGCYETISEDCILLSTRKFAELYDRYIENINKLAYKEKFMKLTSIKRLRYIWTLFCFSLRYPKKDVLEILELNKDEHGRVWLNNRHYSFENGLTFKESQVSDYIWG